MVTVGDAPVVRIERWLYGAGASLHSDRAMRVYAQCLNCLRMMPACASAMQVINICNALR